MTIKELYDFALKNGWEDKELIIDYECNDGWYSFYDMPFVEDGLDINDDDVLCYTINTVD